jgi:hypothetical protein
VLKKNVVDVEFQQNTEVENLSTLKVTTKKRKRVTKKEQRNSREETM